MTLIHSLLAPAAAQAAAPDPADPANFPPRSVEIPRTGLVNTLGFGGLALGGVAAVGAGATLIRSILSGGTVRPSLPIMLGLGGAALLGAAAFGGSKLIGPKTEHALAAGIPTMELARQVDRNVAGYTKIVECADGTFAILRDDPPQRSSGGSSGSSGGSSRPRSGGSSGGSSGPSYPSPGGGSTSRGDDSGSSRNSTSNGNPSSDDF